MDKMIRRIFLLILLALGAIVMAQDEQLLYGDALADAPELAQRGEYGVGVRTLDFVNPDQIDVLNLATDPTARYDRPITVDVWYPAIIPDGTDELTTYSSFIGRSDAGTLESFDFVGRALRDADVDTSGESYPLVIVSHGYPGVRYMMSYLTENLASKGYIVVAIDHTDSTYSEVGDFSSTLYNRSLDQTFVLDEMAKLNESNDALADLINTDNTAIIGYSMGGYGALNSIGAGYNAVLQGFLPILENRSAGNADYVASLDDRIKAAVLFAPWGGDLSAFGMTGMGVWDAEAFANITVPTLWISGSLDDVSGYDAIVGMFDNTINSERYLLTYDNALHNVAPNPPSDTVSNFDVYSHLNEPMWDERRLNNINQHFVTAFLNQYLNGEDYSEYLNPTVEHSNDGIYSVDADGNQTDEHSYWAGFLPRTALGMHLRAEKPTS